MSSTSSLQSSRSPSPPQPPSTSPPTLETLIPHILASKRSLSSITDVYQANSICTSTRQALERSAITNARTSFLRSGIVSQLNVLANVQKTSDNTARRGKAELEQMVDEVEAADARLNRTLEKLRGTIVEAALRPREEVRRNLLDFVDEGGVGGLVDVIKEAVDGAGEGLREFQFGNREFEKEARDVRILLDDDSKAKIEDSLDQRRSPLPDILHGMEDCASDMAKNLESLVSHYDLCVTAVKHTEGGDDVASKVSGELPEGVDVGENTTGAPPKPIDDEGLLEMMRVVEDDAGQVEGTVMDIRERMGEMEALYQRVEGYTEQLNTNHDSTVSAFRLLEDIGRKLRSYITRSQVFLVRWISEKGKIEEQLEELQTLTHFYDGFLGAYDNLLIEIGRRKAMEMKMEREVQAARTKLEKLHGEDLEAREAFRQDQGDFLPVDIWPGLMAGPLRFDIVTADDSAARVPDISKSVIHRAIRRVHGDR